MRALSFVLLLLSLSVNAVATTITLAPQSTSVNAGVITYTNLVTPTSTFSDAIFTLNLAGDFDNNDISESVAISIDGFSLGTVFDNNTGNDLFDFANDDYLGSHSNMVTMTGEAIIAQADWAAIIADGFINITFDLSSGVNCCTDPHAFTSGDIGFNSVPEPAGIALMGLGLIFMFGFSRYKAKAKGKDKA